MDPLSPSGEHPEREQIFVAGREQFAGLRAEWNRLCSQMSYPTPFATWEWMDSWLRSIGRDSHLVLVLARSEGRLLAVLPLTRTGGVTRSLSFAGVDQVYPDHLSLIAAAGDCARLLPRMARAALHGAGAARLKFPCVAEGSEMELALSGLDLHVRTIDSAIAPYIPVTGSFDTFLAGLSGNERYKIRNRTKKMLAIAGVRYGVGDPAVRKSLLLRLRELHAMRAAQKGIESSFDRDDVQQFHALLIDSLPDDQLVFRCLWSEDNIFALFYGFAVQGRVFYFQLGYDPAWSQSSPGIVLLSEVIRGVHEQGGAEFNFLQGDESFKQTWTRQQRTLRDWTVYGPGPAGSICRIVDAAALRARAAGKRLLRRAQ